ncbi:hypothetical protein FRP1_29320 (plasmid) [Pseudonocardia sp. EC080625-04]|uniref:hypothetical protein n=2 Tax=unclassified Pseudonocardia TaxID=2619320 RepID=UPI0006CB484C|nr:hypothetical protein [Pseudonocardia sp. EC080619-01]ALE76875.1 hypothetical protein FRP1_29320 [Pseudonocardia sp. EC080625-04]ALL85840.1 hypothetical protein AD017_32315 [Pseudonocardia sp. EC080619-01]
MTEQPVTPAELRDLAARAEQLAGELAAVEDRMRDTTDEPARHVRFRLLDASGSVLAASQAVLDTASDLARVRGRSGCGADWGVCPEHGNTLTSTGGRSWCTALGCLRSWGYDRVGLPCTEDVTHELLDSSGGRSLLCAGHALDARARVVGSVVTPIDPPD